MSIKTIYFLIVLFVTIAYLRQLRLDISLNKTIKGKQYKLSHYQTFKHPKPNQVENNKEKTISVSAKKPNESSEFRNLNNESKKKE